MFKHKSPCIVLCLVFIGLSAKAQNGQAWLENTMMMSGKINVVVAVIAVIFILLVIYLISIDRRVRKFEQREKNRLT